MDLVECLAIEPVAQGVLEGFALAGLRFHVDLGTPVLVQDLELAQIGPARDSRCKQYETGQRLVTLEHLACQRGERCAEAQADQHDLAHPRGFTKLACRGDHIADPHLEPGGVVFAARRIPRAVVVETQGRHAVARKLARESAHRFVRPHRLMAKRAAKHDAARTRRIVQPSHTTIEHDRIHYCPRYSSPCRPLSARISPAGGAAFWSRACNRMRLPRPGAR
jgi:hypothetical protein